MSYGNTHRFLLRLIASQSVLTLQDTQKYVEANAGHHNFNIREMVKEINEKIKPFKQMIRIVKDEVTSEELVVFVSFGCDDTTKAQNVFSPVELEYFRVLIEQIMTTETREISFLTAINLVNNIKVNNRLMHKTDAERLLNLWCRMQYLAKEDNNYALGVRAIQEFESYFLTNMPDSVEKCYICKEIVYRGYNCPNCPETIHIRCLDVCLSKAQKWPCCKAVYDQLQLQKLRGQSSRNESSRMEASQRLEATQRMESMQHLESTQRMESTQLMESTQRMESTQHMESTQRMESTQHMESTQSLEPTQRLDFAQGSETTRSKTRPQKINTRELSDSDEEINTSNRMHRASKRMRLNS